MQWFDKRLGEIIYPDEEVVEALQALESDANEELRQAIKETLGKIHEIQAILNKHTQTQNH